LSPVPQSGDKISIKAQADNETAYRQLLVQGVLAVLLPTEDLENECLTSLVEQILSELVIGNLVIGKVSEPWLIWEGLIIVARLIRKKNSSDASDHLSNKGAVARDSSAKDGSANEDRRSWSIHKAFWSFVHWFFLMVGMIHWALSTIILSRSLPPRRCPSDIHLADATSPSIRQEFRPMSPAAGAYTQPLRVPLIDCHIWRCIGDVFEINARMPWLRGALSMTHWIALKGPGKVAGFDGTLDR
jgi:splicing suppressor protein 51